MENADVEYGEAINSEAAEEAFRIAVQLRARGSEDLRQIARRAVASAYCVCVTDGEDAAEQRFSRIHAKLINEVERRLAEHVAHAEDE
jgi:hypothetical protein